MGKESTPGHYRADNGPRSVIRQFFERVYSKGELYLVRDLVGTDFTGVSTLAADSYLDREGLKTHVIRIRTAMHDFSIEINGVYVDQNSFTAVWTASGVHERRFLGTDPSCSIGRAGEEPQGERFEVSGTATGIIRGGKIRQNEMDWNADELNQTLGVSLEALRSQEQSRTSSKNLPGSSRD